MVDFSFLSRYWSFYLIGAKNTILLALIAVVGRGMVKAKGTAARVFDAISRADVNIRMIDQGSSEFNIIIGVDAKDFERAQKAIYAEFDK